MAASELKKKTVRGLGWSALDNVAKMGITFVVSIVLARMLSPDEYGLIGILLIFINVFNAIVDSGFTTALVRKQNATEDDFSTAFFVNVVVSIFMAVAMFFCSTPIASFFQRPELVRLTQVMSVVVVINALAIVQKARLTKNIDFKTQTKVTLTASLVSGCVGIGMAYMNYGVWALVGQQISMQSTTTVMLWALNRWFPKFTFNTNSFKELWSFSWKLLVSALIDNGWKEIYQVVIGKFYAPATLGLYTRAKQFKDLLSVNMTTVIQRVSFPALSSIQDDQVRLKNAYRKVVRTTMLTSFVFMLGLSACSKAMILVLLGEKWEACIPFLRVLCLIGMLYPLHALNLNIITVKGRSDLFLKLEIIKKIIAVGPILLGIFYDIYYMIWGSFVASCIAYYINAYYSKPLLNYGIIAQVKDILPSFGVAATMALVLFAVGEIPLMPQIIFPLQLVVGTIVVILLGEIFKLPEYLEIKGVALSIIQKFKRK